ncbi:MAG: hypothetical protein ACU0A2_01010 [Cognatishimia sp.]|uniref:hypothetical protein n=1 Tax=Cognatishimia sp. TaxID=2211648 RepID=UPI004057CDEA
MINKITGAVAASLLATTAIAGGLDRSGQGTSAIFNDPGTVSFSAGQVMPSITGTDSLGNPLDVAPSYTRLGGSFVMEMSENFNVGFIYDQPFGADIAYGGSPLTSMLGGTSADVNSNAISVLGKYQLNENISVFGGLRLQSASAKVQLNGQAYALGISAGGVATNYATAMIGVGQTPPSNITALLAGAVSTDAATAAAAQAAIDADAAFTAIGVSGATAATTVSTAVTTFLGGGGYSADFASSSGVGYTIGAAYEIPEIALRAALSYHSKVKHEFATTESLPIKATPASTTTAYTPQSINLDFQTGIAADTLLTASVRWADWDQTQITPSGLGSNLTSFSSGYNYSLGVARRFNDNFAGSVSLNYEAEGDGSVGSALVPSSGSFGVTIGGRYTMDNVTVSGGINYTKVGDALVGVGGTQAGSFSDNSVVGIGFNVSMSM